MNRLRMVMVLSLLFVSTELWGQDAMESGGEGEQSLVAISKKLYELKSLLESREYKTAEGREKIQKLVTNLPEFSREQLYEKYSVSGWWGVLNIYCFGSVIQGDPLTSGIVAVGELTGAILAAVSLRPNGNGIQISNPYLFSFGYGLLLGSFVYGQVRPWYYAEEENKLLRSALYP